MAGAAFIVPRVIQGFQQAGQTQSNDSAIASIEDDFCSKFTRKDYSAAYQDLSASYQQQVAAASNLPSALGGHLLTTQFTATRCSRDGTPFSTGNKATDLVQVDVTSSYFGSQTTHRTFTWVQEQGTWKIDDISS